jgi:phosphate transport system substrate-binding protein
MGRMLAVLFLGLVINLPVTELAADQSNNTPTTNRETIKIHLSSAGSTTLTELFRAWVSEYSNLHPDTQVSYHAMGSGGGIQLLMAGGVSFVATDVPLTNDQINKAGGEVLHLPVAVTAIVPAYNLPGAPQLRFSGEILANIFLGKITKWDDPAIAAENPKVDLPHINIKVHHYLPDGNTIETYFLTEYLSRISHDFSVALANSTNGSWPLASIKYNGAEGSAGFVAETPGSIACVKLLIAVQNGLKYGSVKNFDGEFVTASPESLTAAAASSVASLQPPDFRILITNVPGKSSYPMASFIWLVMRRDTEKNDVADFLKWILTEGQKLALKLEYPALPPSLVDLELKQLP